MDLLGNRIKELRKKKGLTQEQLGRLSGIHHTNIGRIENRNTMPQADVLYLIAKSLDTSVEWLLMGKLEATLADNAYIEINSESNELYRLCNKLTIDEKNEVIKFIKYMLYQRTMET